MIRVALADVCDRVDYGLTASANWDGHGPRFLRITDIDDSHVDWSTVPRCEVTPQDAAKYALASGDVVVARTGASTGRSQWVTVSEPAVFASYLVRFRAGPRLQSRYLGYVLDSQPWHDFVSGQAHGKSAQPNMSASAMSSFELDLPDMATQRGIAEVLGALDDKIAANTKVVEVGEALAGALIREALADGQQSLGSIAAITMGASPPGTSYNEVGDGMVFYQGVRDFGVRSPSNRVWTTEPVRVAEAGDTLVSVRAPVGRTNVATETTCLGRGLAGLRSQRPATLYHLLRSVPEVWAPYEAEGTVFGSINKAQLDGLSIPMIEESRSDALEVRLAALDARVASALKESERLAQTRDALLSLLMAGKVTVADAESAVGEVL